MSPDAAGQRLDKWLWAARFFRTRSLAAAAIKGGKVRHNGVRAKAARVLKPGDKLAISRGETAVDLTVLSLSDRRLSAPLAAKLYSESESSQQRAAQLAETRRLNRLARTDFGGRPDKRARRLLRRMSGKANTK